MAIPLTRAWRRARVAQRPVPAHWEEIAARNVPMTHGLSAEERGRLMRLTHVLVRTLNWDGGAGHRVTEEMRVTISVQASVLVLGMDGFNPFPKLRSVIVYAARYLTPEAQDGGLVRGPMPVLGQAHLQGPVILSWEDVLHGARGLRDGRNLVLHEFAHNLDMLDGHVDGTPPLGTTTQTARWVEVMTAEFNALRRDTVHGQPTLLDKYGASNPAEFFAVATEAFFELGPDLRVAHRSLYDVLARYYRQDPAARA